MPAIYAHDKFGILVTEQLSPDLKEIIEKYSCSFQIGLQGPDFLFFYRALYKNKINRIGVYYHHHDIYPFMENAIKVIKKYSKDSSQYSYILGFICHFALDNACHPFINEAMKTTHCGHVEIEGDFDRLVLLSDNQVPESYPMQELVPTDIDTAQSIAPFFEELSVDTIQSSLKWMRRIKKFFVAPGVIKRTAIDLVFRATLHYKRLNGHIVMKNANPKCHEETKQIYELLKNAVPDAVQLINNFDKAVDGRTLSNKFHRDFNNNNFN